MANAKQGHVFMHQILAVFKDLRTKGEQLVKDLTAQFGKRNRYEGVLITTTYTVEGRVAVPPETKAVGFTVDEELRALIPDLAKAIDAEITKNEGNSHPDSPTRAKLILEDGTDFGSWSALSLMDLEKRLRDLRGMFKTIPVLDQAMDWEKDTQSGREILKTSNPQPVFFTEKTPVKFTVEETKGKDGSTTEKFGREHIDQRVGFRTTTRFAGMYTPAQLSALLSRLDAILVAISAAIALANQGEVKQYTVGESILNYICGYSSPDKKSTTTTN